LFPGPFGGRRLSSNGSSRNWNSRFPDAKEQEFSVGTKAKRKAQAGVFLYTDAFFRRRFFAFLCRFMRKSAKKSDALMRQMIF
jgi:hypothetical protein